MDLKTYQLLVLLAGLTGFIDFVVHSVYVYNALTAHPQPGEGERKTRAFPKCPCFHLQKPLLRYFKNERPFSL